MTPAVQLHNVTKRFGAQAAVDGLSLFVPAASVYGFIGPNGSGKTTTLRMIARILYPDSGRIEVLGDADHSAADDRISYLPEERGLYKQMKVRDVLRFYSELKGHRASRAEIDDWLERVELPGIGDKKVEALSKGMSQKVQFISAVISKPEMVMLDEPFSGLDPVNAAVMTREILALKRQGTTVIFSTHDMARAEELCDSIFMIYKGKKVLDGTLASIQQTYGQDTIHVRLDGVDAEWSDLPGVTKVTDLGNVQELRTDRSADPQRILAALMGRGRVSHFQIAHPSLHEIFVRIATPSNEPLEPSHA
jgi:ABC-2 type transport system ATP-binding protein